MATKGSVRGIVSNLVTVEVDGPVSQNEICYISVGGVKLMAEVIKVIGKNAYVQVFESTRGMRVGDTAEFEDAYRFIKGLDISQLHVFSYSERPGTKALDIPYVVDAQTKHERSQRLLALSEEKRRAFYAKYVGTERPVLWEHAKHGDRLNGFTDNYIRVSMPADQVTDNTISTIRLGDFSEDGECLLGERLK